MKRNSLLAKSLTLGLAVATAAASMSTPGGLMAPVTVQAADNGSTTGEQQAQADKTFAAMDSKVYEAYNGWAGCPKYVTDFGDYTITTGEITGPDVPVTVTGTAKYVKDFTGFNTAESGQQNGYYVVWQLQVPTDSIANATYLLQSADGSVEKEGVNYKSYGSSVLDDGNDGKKYLSCIFYLTPETAKTKTQKVIVDWDGEGGGAEQTYTIDYSELKFESEIKENNDLTKKWDDVNAAKAETSGTKDEFASGFTTEDTNGATDLEIKWYEGTVTSEEIEEGSAAPVDDISAITKAGIYTYAVSYKADSNYTYTGAPIVSQVTVGTDLSKATVALSADANSEATTEFAYTGSAVTPNVKVAVGGEDPLDASNYQVFYTKADATVLNAETKIDTPSAVGEYKLWVVPTETGSATYYNSKDVEYSIKAAEVNDSNVKTYLSYTPGTESLTYNGSDFANQVKAAIGVQDAYKEAIDLSRDVTISFKKDSQDVTQLDAAGTYKIMVTMTGNYATPKGTPAELGEVEIKQYETKASDITVTSKEVTYQKGVNPTVDTPTVDSESPLNAEKVTVSYKTKGTDQDVENPTDAGVYDVYVAYTDEAGNCKALTETKTDATLTINKAEDFDRQLNQKVLKYNDTNEVSYLLSEYETVWKEDANQITEIVEAAVSLENSSDADYFESGYPKYEDGAVKIELKDSLETPPKNKTINLIVTYTEDSFTNYEAKVTIPVVITAQTPATITVTNGADLTYDSSKEVELEYKVAASGVGGKNFDEITGKAEAIDDLTITSITRNGVVVDKIKDAGSYVVKAKFEKEGFYGELTWNGEVKPATVSDKQGLQALIGLDTTALSYNMEDQIEAIIAKVTPVSAKGVAAGDYEVKVGDGTAATNAGNYTVYAKFKSGANYTSTDWIELGEVTIDKAELALSVTANSSGDPTITLGGKTIANDDTKVNIEYFNGNDTELTTPLESKPTTPGTYKVKVTYTDTTNLTYADGKVTKVATFTIPTPSTPVAPPTYDSGSSNSGGAPTTPATDNKTTTKTETETKADGTQVTTTETKAEDGSVTAKVELKNDTTGVKATVDVAKDANGKVTEATAAVTQTSADKKAGISAATVAQITEAAGTKDVEITTKIVDENGKTVCKLTVNAEDLKAGKQMKVLKIDSKTGEMSLVNKSTYKVDKDGNLAMDDLKKASYMVLTKSEVDAFSKQVLKTVKVEDTKKNVTSGKKTKIALDDGLNMDNVAKITYATSKKSVATVNKNGTITAKKAGKVTVKATVTLKNGKTKTVKMTVTVKASKKK